MLVLDYAVGMTRTPLEVSDGVFAELREHLDNPQLVELTSVIALEGMRSRFNWALGVGAAGFSEGMVCAVPESTGATATGQALLRSSERTLREWVAAVLRGTAGPTDVKEASVGTWRVAAGRGDEFGVARQS
jgi:hypothetical protein